MVDPDGHARAAPSRARPDHHGPMGAEARSLDIAGTARRRSKTMPLRSSGGILLATVFISLPFVIREVAPVLRNASLDQEDAALTIGANRLLTFWHVTLPAIRWGLLYGVSLTFARAVGEIGAVLVVSGGVKGYTETSTIFIFRSLDDRNYIGANAMAVLLATISFVILLLIEFFKNRTEKTELR